METSTLRRIHPLVAIATVSVTLFSLAGIGALTGLLPISHGQSAPTQAVKPAAKPVEEQALPKHAKPEKRERRAAEAPVRTFRDATPATVAHNSVPPGYGPPPGYRASPAVEPPPRCYDCGVIESVREIEKPGQSSGLGAVGGGLVGGLLGRQMGGGHGRDAMTVLGAIGGAVAGNAIEKNEKKVRTYQIAIRFADGSTRLVTQDNAPIWRIGEKVRLVNGVIIARN